MARIKLFSPSELASITLGQLMDMVSAWAPLDAAKQAAKAEKDRRKAEFDKWNEEQYKLETYSIERDWAEGLSQIKLVMSLHKDDWFSARGCKERRTDNAVFGYRKKKDTITVDDKDALKNFSDEHGLKLYEAKIAPIMAAIARELKDTPEIPGVTVKLGEPTPFAEAIMKNLDDCRKG